MILKTAISSLLLLFAAIAAASGQNTAGSTEPVNVKGSMGLLSAIVKKPAMKNNGKCPVVIFMHGFGGNKHDRLQNSIADSLLNHGIGSIFFDFIAHGDSEGEFKNMTVPNEIDDAMRIYRYAKMLPWTGKVALSGHSQGGVVASMVAGKLNKKISAVLLLAPAAVLRDDVIRGNTFGTTYNPMEPPVFVTLPGNRQLGRNFITTAFGLPIYETAAGYKGKACIIHGTGDRIAPYTYGERYHHIWEGSEMHILEADDHGLSRNFKLVVETATDFFIGTLKGDVSKCGE